MKRTGMRRTLCDAKLVVATLFFAGVLSTSLIAQGDEAREWVDSTGKHKITATLVSQTDDKVKLRRDDGRMIEMPIDKLSAKDRAFLKGDAASLETETPKPEKPVASTKRSSSEESTSASDGFVISGDRASVRDFPDDVYLGDAESARELTKAKIGMQWSYRPQTISAPEKGVSRKFSIGKNDVLKESPSLSEPTIAVASGDPKAPIYVSLKSHGAKKESYIARCDVESGNVDVAVLPFRSVTLKDVSPDGNYALSVVTHFGGPASKSYLAITPLTDLRDKKGIVDSVVFDPDPSVKPFGGMMEGLEPDKRASGVDKQASNRVAQTPSPEIIGDPEAMKAWRKARDEQRKEERAAGRAAFEARSKARDEQFRSMIDQTFQSRPGAAPSGQNLASSGAFGLRSGGLDFGEIYDAYWIDSTKILVRTKFEVTLWNLATCKAIYRLETGGAALNVDPARKAFVLSSPHAVSVYNVADGSPLGRLPLSTFGETRDSDNSFTGVSAVFSPSGRKLVLCDGHSADVIDLEKGEKERSVSVDSSTTTDLVWGSDDYLIVNSIGYDLESGEAVCSYSGLGESANSNGQVWTLVDDMTLVGFVAPHAAARVVIQDRKEKKAKIDPFIFHQGDSLAIRCELNNYLDQKKVENYLQKMIKKGGFRYDPSSKNVLVAKCVDTGETRKNTYVEVQSSRDRDFPGFVDSFPGGLRPGEKVTREVTVEVKIFEASLVLERDGKPIWRDYHRTTGIDDAESDPDKSIEEQVKSLNHPTLQDFDYLSLPKNIERPEDRPGNVKPTVNASVTSAGLQ